MHNISREEERRVASEDSAREKTSQKKEQNPRRHRASFSISNFLSLSLFIVHLFRFAGNEDICFRVLDPTGRCLDGGVAKNTRRNIPPSLFHSPRAFYLPPLTSSFHLSLSLFARIPGGALSRITFNARILERNFVTEFWLHRGIPRPEFENRWRNSPALYENYFFQPTAEVVLDNARKIKRSRRVTRQILGSRVERRNFFDDRPQPRGRLKYIEEDLGILGKPWLKRESGFFSWGRDDPPVRWRNFFSFFSLFLPSV